MHLIRNLALAALTLSVLPCATVADAADGAKPLFAADEVLSLSLIGPIDKILEVKLGQRLLRRQKVWRNLQHLPVNGGRTLACFS